MSATTGPEDLQFDRADFTDAAKAAPVCGLCQTPIQRSYYEVNGTPTCLSCRDKIATVQLATAGPLGVPKAIAAGIGAGLLGAVIYYAIVKLTGYEFSLISLLVGFMVGRAVLWGSANRGGPIYQAIAIAITYLAIVGSYAPLIIEGMQQEATTEIAQSAETNGSPADVASATAASGDSSENTEEAAPAGAAQAGSGQSGSGQSGAGETAAGPAAGAAQTEETGEPLTGGQLAIGLAVFAAIVLASPFLAGFSNIIGLIIIAVALYEAWKINRRVPVTITGPFRVGVPATGLTEPPPLPTAAGIG